MKRLTIPFLASAILGGCLKEENNIYNSDGNTKIDNTYDIAIKSVQVDAYSINEPSLQGEFPFQSYSWPSDYVVPIRGFVIVKNNGIKEYGGPVNLTIGLNFYTGYVDNPTNTQYVKLQPGEEISIKFGFDQRFLFLPYSQYGLNKQIQFLITGDGSDPASKLRFDTNEDNNRDFSPVVFTPVVSN